jgi:hypothetical protein
LTDVGMRLFRKMLDAVGGSESNPPETIRAAGALYIRDDSGRITPWSIVAWIRSGEVGRLELSRLQEKFEIIRSGAGFSWKKRPRRNAEQLQEAAAILSGLLLSRQIARLRGPGLAIAASDPVDESKPVFRARGLEEIYTVTLDSSSRPVRVECEHAAGARDATFLYSDYSEEDGLLFPRVIHVLFADSRSGMEVRFSSIRRAPGTD